MIQNFTVAFAIVVIGYVVLTKSTRNKPRIPALSNYALLYESALVGGLFFLVAWVPMFVFKVNVLDCSINHVIYGQACWKIPIHPLPHSDVLVLEIVLALLYLLIERVLYPMKKANEKVARESGPLANFIVNAMKSLYRVQITTIRDKVYVGVIRMGSGVSSGKVIQDIEVIPIASGYRHPTTHKVMINTDYSAVLAKLLPTKRVASGQFTEQEADERLYELSVNMPLSEVALIRKYSDELNALFP